MRGTAIGKINLTHSPYYSSSSSPRSRESCGAEGLLWWILYVRLVNGKWTVFIRSFDYSRCFYNTIQHSPIHGKVNSIQSANLLISNSNINIHTPIKLAFGSNLGFSILPKKTSTSRVEELGIKPPTIWLVDNPLYQQTGYDHPSLPDSWFFIRLRFMKIRIYSSHHGSEISIDYNFSLSLWNVSWIILYTGKAVSAFLETISTASTSQWITWEVRHILKILYLSKVNIYINEHVNYG